LTGAARTTFRAHPLIFDFCELQPLLRRAARGALSMLSHTARPRDAAGADQPRALVERRLRRYSAATQTAVQTVARIHARVADLAVSFPVLLFALALPRREIDPVCALAAAIDGRPLADVAQAAGVPLWLRRLPVDALTKPLPLLPDSDLLRRRVVNHLPRSPKLAPIWLDAVSLAAQVAHEPFAIWIARALTRDAKEFKLGELRLLGLWAWFSIHPGTTGHRLMPRPWQPGMSLKTAREAAGEWRTRLDLHINLGEAPIADTWLSPGFVDNYEFVPLRCADDMVAEAAAMQNCVETYGDYVAHNCSRLWSVRTDGRRVATLRLGQYAGDPLIMIRELKAERNRKVPVEMWWAARQWLHRHDLPSIDMRRQPWGKAPFDDAAWRSLWKPYWMAKQCIPTWLPLKASRDVLWRL